MGIIKEILSGLTKITKAVIKTTNIKKDLTDSITSNISLLNNIATRNMTEIQFLTAIKRVDFGEINDYVSFLPAYKNWICDKKATKTLLKDDYNKRFENKNLDKILRSSKRMLNDLVNSDAVPVKNRKRRVLNLKQNLVVAKKLLTNTK